MSATRTKDGKRAVLMECPDCKTLTVMDPAWEGSLDFDATCDNCSDSDRIKCHKVVVADLKN